ncbi:MAG TPA: class I SAM-dependent methyltransferase [Hanamia sp.]|nr:class I SAM-dependent methyltransferase [Hanamia sp.]
MITHHTQLLNALIEKYNLKSYLEIGVQNPANNFDKIKCEFKVGVDPEINDTLDEDYMLLKKASDDFFNGKIEWAAKPFYFDLIFIDGLHHADQVKRDFENSLKCLNDNGFIVLHDVLPENEQGTKVPRETKVWWGDVYKFAMTMYDYGYEFKTFNIDNGCMVVSKTPIIRPIHPSNIKYDWQTFQMYKHVLLRIVDEVVI